VYEESGKSKLSTNGMFKIKFRGRCGKMYKRFIGWVLNVNTFGCFDCVINKFPFWWHFQISLSPSFYQNPFHLLIRIYCFHSRLQIGYWLCGFVILVVFETNICTSSVLNVF
jgi:hypothetical protein